MFWSWYQSQDLLMLVFMPVVSTFRLEHIFNQSPSHISILLRGPWKGVMQILRHIHTSHETRMCKQTESYTLFLIIFALRAKCSVDRVSPKHLKHKICQDIDRLKLLKLSFYKLEEKLKFLSYKKLKHLTIPLFWRNDRKLVKIWQWQIQNQAIGVGHFYTNYYTPETTTLFKRIKKPFWNMLKPIKSKYLEQQSTLKAPSNKLHCNINSDKT